MPGKRPANLLSLDGNEDTGRYLTFFSDGQLFGVSTSDVVQLLELQDIEEISTPPAYVKGVVRLREEVVPILDVHLRLGSSHAPYTKRACIIMAQLQDKSFGFLVDEVDEVRNIASDQIFSPPSGTETARNDYLVGIARLKVDSKDQLVMIVNLIKLFGAEVLAAIYRAVLPQAWQALI